MNRDLRSEPDLLARFVVTQDTALESIVAAVSRSAGIVMLFAVLGIMASIIIF